MVSFALSYPRPFASAGIAFFFSLSYPLLSDFLGYHGFLRTLIPSPVCFCGYRILFLTLIPAAAWLLGVSWFPSLSHTLACLLLRVSHSFSRSHTRCRPTPGGMTLAFSLSYPLLPDFWGYHGFLRTLIPSPVCFCGYRILFLALIPAAARLLGVSWFPSHSHTLAHLLLQVSHSFSRSHTRCCLAPGGIIIYFLISYPPYLTIFILSDIFLK